MFYLFAVCAKLLQLCPTLCDPIDYSLPGSSVHQILQARILEWVDMTSSKGSSQPRVKPTPLMSPALSGRYFTTRAALTKYQVVWLKQQKSIFSQFWDFLGSVSGKEPACPYR